MIKNDFKKTLVTTKEDNKKFKNSTKCWICDNNCDDNDVKVRDQCHVTKKYRDSVLRDCNINLKLNHKILVVFRNFHSHLIKQELGKFNLKTNVISNGFKKYMSLLPITS